MKRLALIALLVLAAGCKKVPLGLYDARSGRPIRLIGWGQSGATDPTVWTALCAEISTYTGAPCEFKIVAYSATNSTQWATDVNGMLTELVATTKSFQPDFICGFQGEGDGDKSAAAYAANLTIVIQAARAVGPDRMLWSEGLRHYQGYVGSDVRGGQRLLVQEGIAIQGPDIDALQSPQLTRDNGLHFNREGNVMIGMAWFKTLVPYLH